MADKEDTEDFKAQIADLKLDNLQKDGEIREGKRREEHQAAEIAGLKLDATEREAKNVLLVEDIHQSEEAIVELKLAATQQSAEKVCLIESLHRSEEENARNVLLIEGFHQSEEEWREYIQEQRDAIKDLMSAVSELDAEKAILIADKVNQAIEREASDEELFLIIFAQFIVIADMKVELEQAEKLGKWKETVWDIQKRTIFNEFKSAVHACFHPYLTKDVNDFTFDPPPKQHLLILVKSWNSTLSIKKLEEHLKSGHFKSFITRIKEIGECDLFIKNCLLTWLALSGANILAHNKPDPVTDQPFSAADLRRTNALYATEFNPKVFIELESYIEKVSPHLVPPPV